MKISGVPILNLTQHAGTPEQIAQGLFEPTDKEAVRAALTFTAQEILDDKIVNEKIQSLCAIAQSHCARTIARKKENEDARALRILENRIVFLEKVAAEFGEAESALKKARSEYPALEEAAYQSASIWAKATQLEHVLIGGLPSLMAPLQEALDGYGFIPVYAHSDRVSVDSPQTDGTVKKTAIFQHQFFYPAFSQPF